MGGRNRRRRSRRASNARKKKRASTLAARSREDKISRAAPGGRGGRWLFQWSLFLRAYNQDVWARSGISEVETGIPPRNHNRLRLPYDVLNRILNHLSRV